jgi:two-component system OmpR family response regulator
MRILVVEDSPPTRELLKHSLSEAGHSVELAARASTARSLAQSGEFDVLVVDVMLPDVSGIEFCQELRSSGFTTPILFLTAKADVEDRIAGLDAGGDDYLKKPFALAELHARVRALGRRPGLAAARRIERPGVCIDFTARKLERDGVPMPLTAREWAVLEILAARPGRVVPRREVLELAWPEPGASASDSLDVIISRLRRKLVATGTASWIRTVRGEGYVFEVPA